MYAVMYKLFTFAASTHALVYFGGDTAVGLRSFFFFFSFFLALFVCLFVFLTAELAQRMTTDCWSLLEETELSRYGLWRLLEKVIMVRSVRLSNPK